MRRHRAILHQWRMWLAIVLLPSIALAGGPGLSADDQTPTRGASIGRAIVAGDHVYFVAYETANGATLWRTDGTRAGTKMVRDPRPGDAPRAYSRDWFSFELDRALGDIALFVVDDGVNGAELWRSDGRKQGTRQLKDIRPGPRGSGPIVLGVLGERVIILANDGRHGSELWVTDGTRRGTRLLKDIRRGRKGIGLDHAWTGDDRLWLILNDGTHGYELWVTDGTRAGTRLVRDIRPGRKSSDIWGGAGLLLPDGSLVFYADDGAHGEGLWRSDGAEAGTQLVKDVDPGRDAFQHTICPISEDAERFLITMSYDIWVSDGTADGTQFVSQGPNDAPSTMDILDCTPAGDGQGVYITGSYDFASGYGVWWSDGTVEGTVEVARFESAEPPRIHGLTTADGQYVFVANDRVHGWEPWITDGTPSGTRLLFDIRDGRKGSAHALIGEAGGLVYFAANDGVHGTELWATDGSDSGTRMVRDIHPDGSSVPWPLATMGDAFYFTADDGTHGRELWRTDGTPDGTSMLRDINRRPQK